MRFSILYQCKAIMDLCLKSKRGSGDERERHCGRFIGVRASGVVRNFDFLRIRTRFRPVQPEKKGDTNEDGAENEKIPNPHLFGSDTNIIIENRYLLMNDNTKALDNMQAI